MKNTITLFMLITSLSAYCQIKTESWYKFGTSKGKGYLHYKVQEDSLSINTTLDFKFKIDGELLYFNAQLVNEKDDYLTAKSFDIKGFADDVLTLSGTVHKEGNNEIWNVNGEDDEIKTKGLTIVDWNLFYILTTLDYSKKGELLKFNSMEISELNYKENHFLTYISDEVLLIDGIEVQAKKITHNGEGIQESTYWLDAKNNLVKISIDNRKNYIKCSKKAISFQDYK